MLYCYSYCISIYRAKSFKFVHMKFLFESWMSTNRCLNSIICPVFADLSFFLEDSSS